MPDVDPFTYPGIWCILDEACNNNTHGTTWMQNAQAKLQKHGFTAKWEHQRQREFNGLGGASRSLGKRIIPMAFQLKKSRMFIPRTIMPHEIEGNHVLLLSNAE